MVGGLIKACQTARDEPKQRLWTNTAYLQELLRGRGVDINVAIASDPDHDSHDDRVLRSPRT